MNESQGGSTGVGLAVARGAATVASWAYGVAVVLRGGLFDVGLRRVSRLPRPVVSVGNLTTGGTGKTPMVVEIVRRLRAQGATPAVLMRGYGAPAASMAAAYALTATDGLAHGVAPPIAAGGGGREGGAGPETGGAMPSDEAAELTTILGVATPIIAHPSRVAGAAAALQRNPSVSVFVLDDGFQHRQAGRDLDLVLIDATRPFGGERLLPRGFLREPIASLRRADGVIITRSDMVNAEALAALDQRIEKMTGRPALAHAAHRWAELLDAGDRPLPLAALSGQAVACVAGLGNPSAFHEAVRRHAGRIVLTRTFADHHDYSPDDVAEVIASARKAGAAAIVLSEKDWVKWRGHWAGALAQAGGGAVPALVRPRLVMRITRGEEALEQRLRTLVRGV